MPSSYFGDGALEILVEVSATAATAPEIFAKQVRHALGRLDGERQPSPD